MLDTGIMPQYKTNRKLDLFSFCCFHKSNLHAGAFPEQQLVNHLVCRLRVVPNFSSRIVERAKRERAWKSPHARKGDTRRVLSPRRVSPFLAWDDFHARSRFARSTISEEKWGTTGSLSSLMLYITTKWKQKWFFSGGRFYILFTGITDIRLLRN